MPELPEVETVKNTLKNIVIGKKIIASNIYWDNIIAYPKPKEFKQRIKNQTINDVKRRGKWLMFELDDYFLLSHLRMEGKYFFTETSNLFTLNSLSLCMVDNINAKLGAIEPSDRWTVDKVYNTIATKAKEKWSVWLRTAGIS